MEKLMKPAEYAKELGISRQAVYAKIKRGILRAKNVEGKLYIVVDNDSVSKTQDNTNASPKPKTKNSATVTSDNSSVEEYKRLLAAKDETISVLKGTVEDLKESNKQMSTTLKGEIDLLKSAFSEMRTLYRQRIEQMKSEQLPKSDEVLDVKVKQPIQAEELREWIGTKRFLKRQNILKEKQKEKILKRLKKAFKNGDSRLNKIDGKLKVDATKDYWDILS